ncbi:hypothetical protein ACHAXM_010723 [Skeletonema potamos]
MSKVSKSFVPLALSASSSSDDESKTSSSPKPIRHEVLNMPIHQSAQKKGVNNNNNHNGISSNTNSSQSGSWNISPLPTPKSIKQHPNSNNLNNLNNSSAIMTYGQLTPAGRSMTPTCQGRIKAPPVCSAPALQKVASDVSELNDNKVCFSAEEAESCAAKARLLWNNHNNAHSHLQQHPHGVGGDFHNNNEVPLNIDGIGEYWKIHAEYAAAAAEVKAYVSSSSTVVTNTSASCTSICGDGRGRGGSVLAGGGGLPTTTPVMKKDRPPLEVVRTDNEDSLVVHSEDEHNPHPASTATIVATVSAPATSNSSSELALSRDFTDKLVKGNSSRQGRSLQRWLVHSQTEELVRQVAGTVPITRDGRIVLVSASRKSEWILPKGGWDADETREECAARETYEEAGLLGRLGACLDPIDYETSKAKKRRLSIMLGEGGGDMSRPPLPKRIKKVGDGGSSYSPTGPELTEDCTAKSTSKETSPTEVPNSDSKNYSYVRLSLFPMYISEVKNDWPEKGRLRKLVDIDEAIKIMEKEDREYFKRGLEIIRDRGLHLVKTKCLEDAYVVK